MAHHRRNLLNLCFLSSNKINFFHLMKTFITILVIYGYCVKLKNPLKAAASENLTIFMPQPVTPHYRKENNTLAISYFKESFLHTNQIIIDTMRQREADNTLDNRLLSSSKENSKISRKTCNTKNATLRSINSSVSTGPTTVLANIGTIPNIVTTSTKMFMSNVSVSSVISEEKLSTPSSKLLKTSTSSLLLQQQRLLSRPKRYLSFPEGASFSVAVCFTVGIIGNPRYNYMSFGLNWGVAYDLPNTTWILNHLHGFGKRPIPVSIWHRRSRRSLYKEIEKVVDNMGYNGRDCILRALCESRQYFQRTKMSMIGEMMRVLFSFPKQRIFTREIIDNSDIELYDRAYRKARSIADCSEEYNCGFSLLELAFGKYSTPPNTYFAKH